MVLAHGWRAGHEATETGFAYAPVSQAHGHNHMGGGRGGGGGPLVSILSKDLDVHLVADDTVQTMPGEEHDGIPDDYAYRLTMLCNMRTPHSDRLSRHATWHTRILPINIHTRTIVANHGEPAHYQLLMLNLALSKYVLSMKIAHAHLELRDCVFHKQKDFRSMRPRTPLSTRRSKPWHGHERKGCSGHMVPRFKQKVAATKKVQILYIPQPSTPIHARKTCCLLA